MACHYRHLIIYVALSHLMQDGMTALHLASRNGHVEVATALLEKGATIDLTDLVSLSCVLTGQYMYYCSLFYDSLGARVYSLLPPLC